MANEEYFGTGTFELGKVEVPEILVPVAKGSAAIGVVGHAKGSIPSVANGRTRLQHILGAADIALVEEGAVKPSGEVDGATVQFSANKIVGVYKYSTEFEEDAEDLKAQATIELPKQIVTNVDAQLVAGAGNFPKFSTSANQYSYTVGEDFGLLIDQHTVATGKAVEGILMTSAFAAKLNSVRTSSISLEKLYDLNVGGPFGGTIKGIPVYVINSPQEFAVIGPFSEIYAAFVKEGVKLREVTGAWTDESGETISLDQHNLGVVLGELRLFYGVPNINAFGYVTVAAPAPEDTESE